MPSGEERTTGIFKKKMKEEEKRNEGLQALREKRIHSADILECKHIKLNQVILIS